MRADEWRRLRALRLQALRDAPSAFASSLADETAFSDARWQERAAGGAAGTDRVTVIAECGAEWLGLATGLASEPDGEDPLLVGMFVVPHARRRGIGTALVDAVAAWSRLRGASRLYLWVTSSNTAAIELYRQCHFRPTGETRSLPSPRREELRMVNDLILADRLLFLPGAGGEATFWKPVADLLDHPGERILLSWPGFGRNPPHANVRSLEDLYRSVTASIDRTVDIVAQSMGCVLALRAVLEFPRRVRHLVLVALSGGVDLARFGASDWRPAWRQSASGEPPWFVDDTTDLESRLGEIQTSSLLIWGDADPVSLIAVGQHLAHRLRAARLLVVHGGTHALARDRAPEIAEHVSAHLRA